MHPCECASDTKARGAPDLPKNEVWLFKTKGLSTQERLWSPWFVNDVELTFGGWEVATGRPRAYGC